uniref:Peptidase aspartic putative domain-containing protein n=1 Tax=Cacopsylla melanoneura TaxID=428564 RepID=A0A8D8QRZ4_9HEMI
MATSSGFKKDSYLTQNLPVENIDISRLNIPTSTITLADPKFQVTSPIDILIGSELFFSLLCFGQKKFGPSLPVLIKTRLGWIISGSLCLPTESSPVIGHSFHVCQIESEIEKFWELESIPRGLVHSKEEKGTENLLFAPLILATLFL